MTQEFTKGVSTRLSEVMFKRLEDLAKEEQRPMSNMVRVLITEALNNRMISKGQNGVTDGIKSK